MLRYTHTHTLPVLSHHSIYVSAAKCLLPLELSEDVCTFSWQRSATWIMVTISCQALAVPPGIFPISGLFMFIGCTHMFRLLRSHLLLHITVCKTSMLKFSIALEFFNCSLFKEHKNPLELAKTWLDSTRSVWTPRDSKVWMDWIGLDPTLLVCMHPKSVFPNPFSRGPLLASKNDRETSQPFSRKYRLSGWQVPNLKTYVSELIVHILRLWSSFFQTDTKNCKIINSHNIIIHSILPHGLLVGRMVFFTCVTKSFKVGSDCRQLDSHVGCDIQSVTI